MSKLAIGCAGPLAVGVGGGAGASYHAYHKVAYAIASAAALGSLAQIDRSIRKQGPCTRPASGGPSRARIGGALHAGMTGWSSGL